MGSTPTVITNQRGKTMLSLTSNQQIRLLRFSPDHYSIVIATVREDGSIEEVQETGITCNAANHANSHQLTGAILLAFMLPAIGAKKVA